MIVQSFGALQGAPATQPLYTTGSGGSVLLYGTRENYATLYARQPNVRKCVDFLARNVAQLGIHVFRRISTTDRERLTAHQILDWLDHPNPSTRRYRLIESLMGDLGIYFNAYWAKVRVEQNVMGLVRLPPEQMIVEGALMPSQFCWTTNGQKKEFPPTEIVYFNGYNPLNPIMGLSPLETLRRTLAEEAASGEHREQYWRNASRMEGVIERSKDAPTWTPPQQESFREQWQEFANGGAKAGMIPILPKGMTFKTLSFSAKDSEYLSARKLSGEEVASAFHIPLPMVGYLDHATFSNIKEQHKQMYADCLGPWLEMIQQELEGQLLIETNDQDNVYLEFNIADKLKGSFEEQAQSLQILTGRPIMTANESRARINLPSIKNDPSADRLASQQGGPATRPGAPAPFAPDQPNDAITDDETINETIAPVLRATRARQHARLQRLAPAERASNFYARMDRWNAELCADLTPLIGAARAERLAMQANVETFLTLDGQERIQ